jgi:hypothetical protein
MEILPQVIIDDFSRKGLNVSTGRNLQYSKLGMAGLGTGILPQVIKVLQGKQCLRLLFGEESILGDYSAEAF